MRNGHALLFSVLLVASLYSVAVANDISPQAYLPAIQNGSLPTKQPTSVPSGEVDVLDNWTTYVDSLNFFHIVGEVQNNTQTNVRLVKVTANLFDAAGALLDTEYSYTRLDVIEPGQKACFNILFLSPPPVDDIETISLGTTHFTGGTKVSGLVILNASGAYHPAFDTWYEITGQVRNDSATSIEDVRVVGTLYSGPNQTGKVQGCDFDDVNPEDLAPSQTSSFELSYTHVPSGQTFSYALAVEGELP